MVDDKIWEKLFAIKKRQPDEEISQSHCNMALAIQRVTEHIMLLLVQEAKRLTGSDNLCLAGGVALNCVANGKILKLGLFKNVFIQPASSDAGGSLGAALSAYHIYCNKSGGKSEGKHDLMKGSLLGPAYTDEEVLKASRKFDVKFDRIEGDSFYHHISGLLQQGKVIAWHQGRMEFGPRALGNRSILGDPRIGRLQNELNIKVKFRESFRPFAPIILEEELSKYFDIDSSSPYMLLAANFKEEYQIPYPPHASNWSMSEKLRYKRSFVPAVTHIDFTARLQTVNGVNNEKLYTLLKTFFSDTGCPMLINTSFNTDNEPIVNSPTDAFRCFMSTHIDYLVINNFIFTRNKQDD